MKYVVLQHSTKLPVIVCGMMTSHDELAAGYQAKGYKPTSAGFLRLAAGQFQVFGFSVSLQLTPNAGDEQLIRMMHEATLKTAPAVPSVLEPVSPSVSSFPHSTSANPHV